MTVDTLRQVCFFLIKSNFLGFYAVGTSTCEDSRPFHSCINYYCKTDIVISFLGLWTDRLHNFWILICKHVGTQKISTWRSKLGVSYIDRNMHPRMTGRHNKCMTYKWPTTPYLTSLMPGWHSELECWLRGVLTNAL